MTETHEVLMHDGSTFKKNERVLRGSGALYSMCCYWQAPHFKPFDVNNILPDSTVTCKWRKRHGPCAPVTFPCT